MTEYETDLVSWSDHQAALLRRLMAGDSANEQVDWANIIEEIESVGASERSRLASHIRTIIEHLAKLEASPATEPRKGWIETVLRTRGNVETVLRRAPSLRPSASTVIAEEQSEALRLVGRIMALYDETPRVPLARLHYSEAEVLGDWLPPT